MTRQLLVETLVSRVAAGDVTLSGILDLLNSLLRFAATPSTARNRALQPVIEPYSPYLSPIASERAL